MIRLIQFILAINEAIAFECQKLAIAKLIYRNT